MKQFILKLMFFLAVTFILLNAAAFFILQSDTWSGGLTWKNILEIVHKSRRFPGNNSSVVILGDSVAGQLFPALPVHRFPESLTANGRVLMPGNYILACNALENNPNIRYIILILNPFSIGRPFENPQTFQNFLKPFYTFGNLPHITPLLHDKINQKPLANLVIFPFFKAAAFLSDVRYEPIREKTPSVWQLSDIAAEYLQKLAALCAERGVQLIITSPPAPRSALNASGNWRIMKEQAIKRGVAGLLKNYFANIQYLDDACFADKLHFTPSYLTTRRREIIQSILPPEPLALLAHY